MSDRDAGALLAVCSGALVAGAGLGGVTTTVVSTGVASGGGGGAISMREVVPNTVTGSIAKGSPRTLLGAAGLPAALANADPVDCHRHSDGPIRTGSISVFVDGLRVARASDQTSCGAMLCDGEPTVLIGGAPADSAPPDPLEVIQSGKGTLGAALGHALSQGISAVTIASRYAESMLASASAAVTTAANSAAAEAAEIGEKLTHLSGPALGSWMSTR